MGLSALNINANTMQFFTRNPRGSKAKAISTDDITGLIELMKENQFAPVLAHAPYTLNPCSSNEEIREFALEIMRDDLLIMELLPNNMYNFHPGCHVGQGVEKDIEQIIELLNSILSEDQTTMVLLETMSGKGTEIGSTFQELKTIIDGVKLKSKVGVCLDTCHVYSAGYDIVNDLEGVLSEFDEVIGLNLLYAIHLNDSIHPLGSKKDRHQKLGEGTIGLNGIVKIINHPKLRNIPFFLETPNDLNGYKEEIDLLRKHFKGSVYFPYILFI